MKMEWFFNSGSSHTWLPTSAYQALCEEIKLVSQGMLTRYVVTGEEQARQLYDYGRIGENFSGFPPMTLHFGDEGELVLDI